MMAEIVPIFDVGDYQPQIARAAELLRAGGVVVLPTDTVYGAAALLNHAEGLTRLKARRGDGDGKPFTIHLAKRDDAPQYLGDVSDLGKRMMRKLWPGPVTLAFSVPSRRRTEVAQALDLDESEIYDSRDGIVMLRCPDHPVCADVLGAVDGPVGMVAVESPEAAGVDVDLVLEAGPGRHSKPSTILRVDGDSYHVVRAGIYDERIIERLLRTTVLFVCSGNTCRSPMSEAIARKFIAGKLNVDEQELDGRGISVLSAGSFAMPGARATPQAVEALNSQGIDLSRHRSRPLSVELIHQADAIFTMGRSHAAAVTALVPSARDKTLPLDPDGDVDDPIGGDLQLYENLAGRLRELIEARVSEHVLP